MKRIAASPFTWFAILLAACEIISWSLSPYRLGLRADETTRNATKHRGWPEYLDVKDAEEPLLVLISNSQGVGPEIADRDRIYAAALGDHLSGRGYRFENWSTGGLRTTEIELLVAKAAARGADHVLLVLTVNNFDPPELINLDYPFSDIPLLAGEPGIWPLIGDSLFMENTEAEDLAIRFAARNSSLVRSRMAVTDLAAAHIPLEWHPLALGHQVRPGNRLDDLASPQLSPYFPAIDLTEEALSRQRKRLNKNPRTYDPNQIELRLETFTRLHPGIVRLLENSGTRISWVWNPLAPDSTTGEGRRLRNRFLDDASSLIRDSGIEPHDLTEALEGRHFLSHGHFNEGGHQRFARILVEILDDEVAAGGGAS